MMDISVFPSRVEINGVTIPRPSIFGCYEWIEMWTKRGLRRGIESSWRSYPGIKVEIGMDETKVEGTSIPRPAHVARSSWMARWERMSIRAS